MTDDCNWPSTSTLSAFSKTKETSYTSSRRHIFEVFESLVMANGITYYQELVANRSNFAPPSVQVFEEELVRVQGD